jgi:hypothetical protein
MNTQPYINHARIAINRGDAASLNGFGSFPETASSGDLSAIGAGRLLQWVHIAILDQGLISGSISW